MAKLPPLKRPKQGKTSLDELIKLTGQFFNDIIYMLNRRLTVSENMDGEVRTIELDGNFPVTFAWTRPTPPKAIWPVKIERKDKTATALSAGFIVEWEYEDGQVSIINTPGLTSSAANTYNLTIISLVG
jgi:hypothetical protein